MDRSGSSRDLIDQRILEKEYAIHLLGKLIGFNSSSMETVILMSAVDVLKGNAVVQEFTYDYTCDGTHVNIKTFAPRRTKQWL